MGDKGIVSYRDAQLCFEYEFGHGANPHRGSLCGDHILSGSIVHFCSYTVTVSSVQAGHGVQAQSSIWVRKAEAWPATLPHTVQLKVAGSGFPD